jgi:uncharacterized repeat protein (TIGR01451 family)/CSLREA domain-containing protein
MLVSRRRSIFGIALVSLALLFAVTTAAQAATFQVNSTADAVDADTTDGVCAAIAGDASSCTLRAAIDEANAQLSDDVIQLTAGTYGRGLRGTGDDANDRGDLDIENAGSLTIVGGTTDRDDTIVSASDGETSNDRVFHLLRDAEVTIQYVTVQDGDVENEGAGILVAKGATLNLTDSRVYNNNAFDGEAGGGIRSEGSNAAAARSTVNITRSLIDGNHAEDGGGGFDNHGDATVIDSTFEDNDTCGDESRALDAEPGFVCDPGESGGAIRQGEFGESLYVSGSTFNNNHSGDDGGAIEHHEENPGGTAVIVDSTFTGNTAVDDGGAVADSTGSLDISGSTFSDNVAHATVDDRCRGAEENLNCPDHGGGAVWSEGVAVKVTDSTFTGNKSDLSGGAIYIEKGRLDVIDSTLEGNEAQQSGGGIYIEQFEDLRNGRDFENQSRLRVVRSTIEGNTAFGRCVPVEANPQEETTAYFCNREDAAANDYAWYPDSDPPPNTDAAGGGIYNNGKHFEVIDSHVDNNVAGEPEPEPEPAPTLTRIDDGPGVDGGGIYQDGGQMRLVRSSVDGNTATDDGAGIMAPTGSDSLSIVSSSVSENEAGGDGGGVFYDSNSDEPTVEEPDALVINSTLSGNAAPHGWGGAFYAADGGISFVNATVVGNNSSSELTNGRSIAAEPGFDGAVNSGDAQVFLRNTLLNGNTPRDCGGQPPESRSHNIDSDDSCNLDPTPGSDDQPSVVDAKIGPLANNGGGTRTHALLADSPAIDTATNRECPALDQRGGLRPPPEGSAGTICDVGAYERHSLADLAVTKSDSPDPVTAGGNVTYTLTVTNNGPDNAGLVAVRDDLPAGVTLVSASPSQGTCSGSGPVDCALGTVPSGASATVTIVVTTSGAGTLTNKATVSAPLTDPDPENNSATQVTTVNGQPAPTIAPPAPPAQQECTPSAPRTSISRNTLLGERRELKFTGRSLDFRCVGQETAGGVKLVRVAVALHVGDECRFLARSGRLTKRRACDSRVYMNARVGDVRSGKVPWTFALRKLRLPAGKYSVVALGTDSQNVQESTVRRFNRKTFVIR